MRILVVDCENYSATAINRLANVAEVHRFDRAGTRASLRSLLTNHRIQLLVAGLGSRVDADLLDQTASIRCVATPTTGLDHLDVDYLRSRQIKVVSLAEVRERIQDVSATAELAWGLLLAVRRYIVEAHLSVKNGGWDRTPFLGRELRGSTLGVIGLGRLGSKVAQYGRSFGMRVIAHDPAPKSEDHHPPDVDLVPLEHLLAESDVVSLHMDLNQSSRRLLSAQRIASMKSGAVVINTARGQLVDESALAEAVLCGHLAGVGSDVLADEHAFGEGESPSPLVMALRKGANVVLTPHIGGFAIEAIEKTHDALVDFLIGEMAADALP